MAADQGRTAHPVFVAYLLAQRINRLAGGNVVAPWEVYDLDEAWLDAAAELDRLPGIMRRKQAEQKVFDEARNKNKDYSRLH